MFIYLFIYLLRFLFVSTDTLQNILFVSMIYDRLSFPFPHVTLHHTSPCAFWLLALVAVSCRGYTIKDSFIWSCIHSLHDMPKSLKCNFTISGIVIRFITPLSKYVVFILSSYAISDRRLMKSISINIDLLLYLCFKIHVFNHILIKLCSTRWNTGWK